MLLTNRWELWASNLVPLEQSNLTLAQVHLLEQDHRTQAQVP